jgi:hypothetical protein
MKPPFQNPLAALEFEIMEEKAAALGRLGRRLEAGLASLRDFDAEHGSAIGAGSSPVPDASLRRKTLLAEVAEAYWYFMVQREACGLRDSASIIRAYGVPREVVIRAGPNWGRR